VATDSPLAAIALGGVHGCALARDGRTLCWGRNLYGQVGDGTTTDRSRPVAVTGDRRWSAVYANGGHSCGTSAGGDSYCWGYNLDGQLGDGTRTNRARPAAVARQRD
jgi:alpha-tubulin suppressor-like RCC1 family protein